MTDVALEILGNQDVECLRCRVLSKLKDVWTWVSDRAGLKVVHCECPTCDARWRRIVCP